MDTILNALQGLIGHSVPTILLIFGVALFIYPFLDVFIKKDIPDDQKKSAKKYGLVFLSVGILLALFIKPADTEQGQEIIQQVYNFPAQLTSTPLPSQDQSDSTEIGDEPTHVVTEKEEDIIVDESSPTKPPPTSIPNTATPQPVTNVVPVWSIEENGVRVNINTSGVYEISYLDDAYSPWPNEQYSDYQGWTTILRIYVNSAVEWGTTDYGLVGPVNHDHYLGPGGYYLDKNEAISSSKGDSRTIRLSAGDYITLVTLDEKGRYFDNRGKVDIGITYLGSN
jgi:hypothetical protein